MNTWEELSIPWRTAFEEAWTSFRLGNFGVGAVLIDERGTVVGTGRNMVAVTDGDQPLAGNYMAHAEMNLFAQMPAFLASGLRLITTLEPCLMCAATAIFLDVEGVAFAAADEYFADLGGLWQHHVYTRDRHRPADAPVHGPPAALARLLPLIHTLRTFPDGKAAAVGRTKRPELAVLADDPDFVDGLQRLGSVEDAVRLVADHLAAGAT